MAEEATKPLADVTTTPAVEQKPADQPAANETPATVPASDAKPEQKQETKPQEEKGKEKPVVPEKYDLKLSENSVLDDAFIKRTEAYAKAQGLSQEDAQALLKAQEEDVAAFMADQKADWRTKAINDPEIGGDKLQENIALANRVLEKFGSPALKKDLNRSGYGNHPEMVRLFVKIGQAAGEDKFVVPGSQGGSAQKTLAERLYGDS